MPFIWVNGSMLTKYNFLQELPEGEWFCCSSCSETRSSLDKIISDGAQLLVEQDLEIIKKKHVTRGLCMDTSKDLKWQLLSGKRTTEDGSILLSAAVPIFHVSPILFDLICSCINKFLGQISLFHFILFHVIYFG